MEYPIRYALSHPERWPLPDDGAANGLSELLEATSELRFRRVDPEVFPAPSLAREALIRGNGAPAALNAANETAVAAFLAGTAPFSAIVPAVAEVLDRHGREAGGGEPATIDEALEWDSWGRRRAREVLAQVGG